MKKQEICCKKKLRKKKYSAKITKQNRSMSVSNVGICRNKWINRKQVINQ